MSKDTPFFSVVMPVYNVEKHLTNAVYSIVGQTFTDFEIILVDDCSADSSGKICDMLAFKHDFIKVIHFPKNKGVSMARNAGLEASRGSYVFFMDPDDTVEFTLFEQLVASLKRSPAQAVVFGMIEDYYDNDNILKKSFAISYGSDFYLDNTTDIHSEVIHLEEKTFYGYPWNKVYNREYLLSIGAKFEVVPLIEDIMFNISVFQKITSLNILNITPYHYMKRIDASLTNRFVPDYFDLHRRRVSTILEQYKSWDACTPEVLRILANIYVRYIFSALQRNCDPRSGMNLLDRIRWLKSLLKDDVYKELIPYASSENKTLSIMIRLLKRRLKLLLLMVGRMIYLVKNKMPIVFAKVKQNR